MPSVIVLSAVMPSRFDEVFGIMMSAVMLNVIMLGVVIQLKRPYL
jgi:hypothetical protein